LFPAWRLPPEINLAIAPGDERIPVGGLLTAALAKWAGFSPSSAAHLVLHAPSPFTRCRMKIRLLGLIALLAFCPRGADASIITYVTTLNGATEIPPSGSPGTGHGTVKVDDVALTMEVIVDFTGLGGTTTASHIHCCTTTPGSANVGVATQLPTFTGFPLGVTSGTYDHTFDLTLASTWNPAFVTAQGGISNATAALRAGMATGNAYLNIHTSTFPGGEIRGLLTTAVPEPATLSLFGMGLATTGLRKWRARKRA
jgi:hypothetical protein